MARHVIVGAPLHVLVLGSRATPETFLQQLFTGLAAQGFEVSIGVSNPSERRLVSAPLAAAWIPPSHDGKRATSLRAAWRFAHPSPRRLSASHRASLRKRAVAAIAPDVIYFPWNSAAIADDDLLDLDIPAVMSCRGSQVLVAPWDTARPDFPRELRRAFDRIPIVHCVSEHIAKEAEPFGLDPARARVIRPAVESELFCPDPSLQPAATDYRIVMTGDLTWVKGHEYAVAALASLRDAGVEATLRLIGDGPDRERIVFAAHDLGVHDRVVFLGRRTPARVLEELQQANVYWVTSVAEGISNAALEAMSCELPVVTTSAGGMREAISDGVEGFVVPVRDPAAIAGATARILRDDDLRSSLGAAARQRVVRDFQLADQILAFAALLREAAGARPQ